ncbi:MAG: hypothetical protein AAF542_01095 [Pseudomonadota bacterium]
MADKTQRDLVAAVAKDFYAGELGLTEDTLETFNTVTNLGIIGCGFDYEVLVSDSETRCVLEAPRCPIVEHANLAGYENGNAAMDDLSLWCDTYDNFESEAVSPSQALVHSHCIGKGDKYCRIICKTTTPEERREKGEHIFDFTSRLRKAEQENQPDGPWALDGKSPDLVEEMIRDFTVGGQQEVQKPLASTLYDRKKMGVEVWGRIGAVSTLMSGQLMGWDEWVSSVPGRQGEALKKAAHNTADALGLDGSSAKDAASLHKELIAGQGFAAYQIEEISDDRVEGSCGHCPIIGWGEEAGLSSEFGRIKDWCSAARTQEAEVIASDLTHTYTKCIGRGDKTCHWVIEKN